MKGSRIEKLMIRRKKEEEYYEKGKAVMADQPDTRTAVDYIMK